MSPRPNMVPSTVLLHNTSIYIPVCLLLPPGWGIYILRELYILSNYSEKSDTNTVMIWWVTHWKSDSSNRPVARGGSRGSIEPPNPRLAHAQIGHCTRPPARGVMAGRKRSSDVPPTAKITKYFCSEDPSGSYNAVFDSSTETERPEESESAEL